MEEGERLRGQLATLLSASPAGLGADLAVVDVELPALGSAGLADLGAEATVLAIDAGVGRKQADASSADLGAIQAKTGALHHRSIHPPDALVGARGTGLHTLAQRVESAFGTSPPSTD